jgi:hypothetical protein
MRDEIDARIWAAHHEQFSDGIAALLGSLRTALNRLTAIHFAAPRRDAPCGRR